MKPQHPVRGARMLLDEPDSCNPVGGARRVRDFVVAALFSAVRVRRAKMDKFAFGSGGLFGQGRRERLIVLSAYCALLFTVEVQQVSKVFPQSPECVDGQLNAKVSGVAIAVGGNLQRRLPAAVELP